MKRTSRSLACLLGALLASTALAHAQSEPKRIVLRGGDSVELRNYLFVVNCQSIMVGTPLLDVLEGPEEVTVTLREGMVFPRTQKCPKPVPGGTVIATAKAVAEPKEAKLTIRLKFNTKDGERQGSNTYMVSLIPAGQRSGDAPRMSLPPPTFESTAPPTAQ
jgi:hypothetical protein